MRKCASFKLILRTALATVPWRLSWRKLHTAHFYVIPIFCGTGVPSISAELCAQGSCTLLRHQGKLIKSSVNHYFSILQPNKVSEKDDKCKVSSHNNDSIEKSPHQSFPVSSRPAALARVNPLVWWMEGIPPREQPTRVLALLSMKSTQCAFRDLWLQQKMPFAEKGTFRTEASPFLLFFFSSFVGGVRSFMANKTPVSGAGLNSFEQPFFCCMEVIASQDPYSERNGVNASCF